MSQLYRDDLLIRYAVTAGAADMWQLYDGERTQEAFIKYVSRLAKPPSMQRIYAFDLMAREFYNAAGDPAKQEEVMGRANRTAQHFGYVESTP
eukprot:9489818-Pyramimonas_sp.AAC.2